jgi:hypothetical protein
MDNKTKKKGFPRINVLSFEGMIPDGDEVAYNADQLAAISAKALDDEYHYGPSTPGNSFGWQANLNSAAYAKKIIDKGVTNIEEISDAIHKGWNVTAQAFVENPYQFDDTEKLELAGNLEKKIDDSKKLMTTEYADLKYSEQEKDRVVARALLKSNHLLYLMSLMMMMMSISLRGHP